MANANLCIRNMSQHLAPQPVINTHSSLQFLMDQTLAEYSFYMLSSWQLFYRRC